MLLGDADAAGPQNTLSVVKAREYKGIGSERGNWK
jgi:hypothetical protein